MINLNSNVMYKNTHHIQTTVTFHCQRGKRASNYLLQITLILVTHRICLHSDSTFDNNDRLEALFFYSVYYLPSYSLFVSSFLLLIRFYFRVCLAVRANCSKLLPRKSNKIYDNVRKGFCRVNWIVHNLRIWRLKRTRISMPNTKLLKWQQSSSIWNKWQKYKNRRKNGKNFFDFMSLKLMLS